MFRDEMVRQLVELPVNADVLLQLGDGHVEIAGLAYRETEPASVLLPHQPDIRDVLADYRARAAVAARDDDT